MLDLHHPNHRSDILTDNPSFNARATSHQAVTLDEFTVARIQRLWDDWLRHSPPEQRNKHRFHQNVIKCATGLERVRLATVYVLLARYDASLSARLSPA